MFVEKTIIDEPRVHPLRKEDAQEDIAVGSKRPGKNRDWNKGSRDSAGGGRASNGSSARGCDQAAATTDIPAVARGKSGPTPRADELSTFSPNTKRHDEGPSHHRSLSQVKPRPKVVRSTICSRKR